ncbi:XdhC family protein [Anaeromyxobacter diazotrophicus]|uniref:XdhC/CoxI family protein n=1 Tax=Anaeromyxobacter diazotrophicus TaxID=2590199 RepID=A0A7I9VR51_9BACT|nr:XdhC/CoxI family protein [Anaeromyxobacter diazotrophicus]GEJ58903.1 XdhC/CoxI family protein [Anaeromyxobacter diazotrophicus]
MSEQAEVLERLAAWADAGLGVALAAVMRTWGSAPRRPGSLLGVNARGEFVGSVSGGCVEAAVIEAALEVIAGGGPPRVLDYRVTDERAWQVGLACGGALQVYVERPGRELVRELLAALAAKEPVVLATEVATGAPRLVRPHAPDPGLDPALAQAAREASLRDRTGVVETPGGALFLRAFNPPVRVVLVGAVQIAQALAPMARLAGYDVLVIDPRRAFATEERFPGTALAVEWPDAALARAGLDRHTAVVTLTHDPKLDDPALAAALRSEAFYVGCLGSARTQAGRLERLAAMGFGPGDLARLRGPVGLPIGAVSPGEIAVSILAQLVAALRRPEPPAT